MDKSKMPVPPGARPEESEDVEQPELDAASEPIPAPSAIAPKPASKKRMKVRAIRAGFIHNERKVEGDMFEVDSNMIGSWFEYQDPVEQKKHLQRQLDKKKKANARGLKDQEKELADE